jgi:hypothetical protein
MASFPQVRRILHVHSAHRTVGVSGVASSFRPDRLYEHPAADRFSAVQMRVLLVAAAANAETAAALAAFERILAGRGNVQWDCTDLASAEIAGLGTAHCAAVFGPGIQIVDQWPAVEVAAIQTADLAVDGDFETEVEIAAAAQWHPVVAGLRPFMVRHRRLQSSRPCERATALLVGKWAGAVLPVAWARQSGGRAFGTLLGHPGDFHRREFARLLLNAIDWVGQ